MESNQTFGKVILKVNWIILLSENSNNEKQVLLPSN
jgi:hypothetical protein